MAAAMGVAAADIGAIALLNGRSRPLVETASRNEKAAHLRRLFFWLCISVGFGGTAVGMRDTP